MPYNISILTVDGKPVSGGLLTFTDVGTGAVVASFHSDATGTVTITDADSGLIGNAQFSVTASAPGYYDATTPSAGLLLYSGSDFRLQPKRLSTAVLLLAGAAVGLAVARRKRKRKVGAFDVKNIPPLAQNLIVVGALGITAYLLLKGKSPNKDLPNFAATELDKLIAAGNGPTISESEAAGFSATIVAAADDCGTDEDAIWNVMLQLNNTADVLLLIKVYGIRQYKGCFDGDFFGYHNRNLAETLTSELSGTWIGNINQLFINRGINFKL